MNINRAKCNHAAIRAGLVTILALQCGPDLSAATGTGASAAETSELIHQRACNNIEAVSLIGLRSIRPKCGVYFIAASDEKNDIQRANDLKETFLRDSLLKAWLSDVIKELGNDTPFLNGITPGLKQAGARGWNYFDIGRPIDLGTIKFDSEFQEMVREIYPNRTIPGVLYDPLAVNTTFKNELFERLAGATFTASGFSLPLEEYCGFQSFTWAADRITEVVPWDPVAFNNVINDISIEYCYSGHLDPVHEQLVAELISNSLAKETMERLIQMRIAASDITDSDDSVQVFWEASSYHTFQIPSIDIRRRDTFDKAD